MSRNLLATLICCLALLACSVVSRAGPAGFGTGTPFNDMEAGTPDTSLSAAAIVPLPIHVGRGVAGPWYELYFTDPANPAAQQYSGGPDEPLVAAIDAARISVHAAMYSLSLNDVRNALIRAHRRGLDVKAVMESDNIDAEDPQMLKDAGIPLLGDRRQGLMHDKFMILDGVELWTGSMNFTNSGAYEDNNVLLRIRSAAIADDFESEFEEMFLGDHFGPYVGGRTPYPSVTVDNTSVDVYFSPDDHVEKALQTLLDTAQTSIHFLAFSFTSDQLGQALVRARAAGVEVSGVMDADQAASNIGTEFPAFRTVGLDVRLDGNPGQMHEKIMIIDREIVVVGSYNFTASADKSNDENLLVIDDSALAGQFEQEFGRIRDLAQP
jgi:phosphatidylserine/phosphatidylglycerophosphate/cardiolipin synthase-like enzyme